jgi:hypothetical protein
MSWLINVAFGDDRSRYRTGHAAKNMAVFRRFALVQADKTKRGVKAKRKSASWDTNLLLQLLHIK